MNNWLSLNDYSNKYKVSLSTLRRNIKAEKIKFTFQHGKYFLQDTPHKKNNSVANSITQKVFLSKTNDTKTLPAKPLEKEIVSNTKKVFSDSDLASYSFLNIDSATTENKAKDKDLLKLDKSKDIKFSKKEEEYQAIIQRQKDQILHLQSEIINLNTLIMFLEK